MAPRTRQVIWTESAQLALDEILALAERGRVVPEIDESTLRELFVYDYRLMYRVREGRVVIVAFLHGARDFSTWQREAQPKL